MNLHSEFEKYRLLSFECVFGDLNDSKMQTRLKQILKPFIIIVIIVAVGGGDR